MATLYFSISVATFYFSIPVETEETTLDVGHVSFSQNFWMLQYPRGSRAVFASHDAFHIFWKQKWADLTFSEQAQKINEINNSPHVLICSLWLLLLYKNLQFSRSPDICVRTFDVTVNSICDCFQCHYHSQSCVHLFQNLIVWVCQLVWQHETTETCNLKNDKFL